MTFIEEHRRYLADEVRVAAYERALQEVVKPGDVVLDLASGTGILGLLACRAGARRVYAVEAAEIIGLARQICRANGYGERVTFVNELSTDVELPEKVDVVVTEQIGRFGVEVGGLLEVLSDARERSLKPGGRLIPARVDLYVAPVECPETFEQVAFWSSSPAGFDFRPARVLAENTTHPVRFQPDRILGDPFRVASLDFSALIPTSFKAEECVTAARDGWLHGLAGWFSASLSPGVVLSNSPLEADSIKRNNLFFPIEKAVSLARGDQIRITMHLVPASLMMTWKVEIRSGADGDHRKAAFDHSTFKGMCLSEEDLARTRPNFLPGLRPRAQALLAVLSLCDGRRPLSEIEQEAFRHYPNLFRSPREAAKFVAEIVRSHSR